MCFAIVAFMQEIFTIGHSTRPINEFIEILNSISIAHLIDIRHFPGSRRYPHFNKDSLAESLAKANIKYTHIVELGGRRKPEKNSVNTAWRVEAFKGYADHMATDEFKKGMKLLMDIASKETAAYMCSEAVWWSCHRALVSDYLKWKGWLVRHIMAKGKTEEHPYTKAAKIIEGKLSYQAD